jgi:hypothetical protein
VGRLLLFLTVLSGWTAASLGGSPAAPAKPDWERHCEWRLARLTESFQLSADQGFAIRSYLEQQRDLIELFAKFGNLDGPAQKRKVQEICEVTALKIEMALLPEQHDLWQKWETQFRSRKAISRGKDSLFQGRTALVPAVGH